MVFKNLSTPHDDNETAHEKLTLLSVYNRGGSEQSAVS